MVTRWEYKKLSGWDEGLNGDWFREDRHYRGQQVTRKGDEQAGFHRAQELGEEGWELVAVHSGTWIFKRPLPN